MRISERQTSLQVWADDMKGLPTFEQSYYGRGNGSRPLVGSDAVSGETLTGVKSDSELYKNMIERVVNGSRPSFGMNAFQISTDLPEATHFEFIEGNGIRSDILYSDYIGTGKPLPVVVGYDLRNLFSVGDICRADMSAFNKPPEGVSESDFQKNYYNYFPDGNLLIEIVGILSEDSYMFSPMGHLEMFYPKTAIILPRFDVIGTKLSELTNDIDVEAYRQNNVSITLVRFLTKLEPDKAHTRFMEEVGKAGLEGYILDTNINADYRVKGRSVIEYNRNAEELFIVSSALLVIVSLLSVVRTVDRNIKIYSVHYLVGATRVRLYLKTVIGNIIAGAVYLFCYRARPRVENTINAVLLENSFMLKVTVTVLLCYIAFILLVAFVKIHRTDFSRVIKEDI